MYIILQQTIAHHYATLYTIAARSCELPVCQEQADVPDDDSGLSHSHVQVPNTLSAFYVFNADSLGIGLRLVWCPCFAANHICCPGTLIKFRPGLPQVGALPRGIAH